MGDDPKDVNLLEGLVLPTWIKILIGTIQAIGWVPLFLGLLLAVLIGWLNSPILDSLKTLMKGQLVTHTIISNNNEQLKTQNKNFESLITINRAICINLTEDKADRDRCNEYTKTK